MASQPLTSNQRAVESNRWAVTNFFECPGLDPLAKALVEIPCSVPGGKLEGGRGWKEGPVPASK